MTTSEEEALQRRILPALRALYPNTPCPVLDHEARVVARAIAPLVRVVHHEDPDDVEQLMATYGEAFE